MPQRYEILFAKPEQMLSFQVAPSWMREEMFPISGKWFSVYAKPIVRVKMRRLISNSIRWRNSFGSTASFSATFNPNEHDPAGMWRPLPVGMSI